MICVFGWYLEIICVVWFDFVVVMIVWIFKLCVVWLIDCLIVLVIFVLLYNFNVNEFWLINVFFV